MTCALQTFNAGFREKAKTFNRWVCCLTRNLCPIWIFLIKGCGAEEAEGETCPALRWCGGGSPRALPELDRAACVCDVFEVPCYLATVSHDGKSLGFVKIEIASVE